MIYVTPPNRRKVGWGRELKQFLSSCSLFERARLYRRLKKSKKQIPRGLKSARDDKNKGPRRGPEGPLYPSNTSNRVFQQAVKACSVKAGHTNHETAIAGRPSDLMSVCSRESESVVYEAEPTSVASARRLWCSPAERPARPTPRGWRRSAQNPGPCGPANVRRRAARCRHQKARRLWPVRQFAD